MASYYMHCPETEASIFENERWMPTAIPEPSEPAWIMLKFCDMSLMAKIEDAIPYAAKDSFEYEVAEILTHRPLGPRKIAGTLRPKSDYEFQCLWKDIELSDNQSGDRARHPPRNPAG